MEYMRKCVSILAAFSLAFSLLTAVPARAAALTADLTAPSETISDPDGDAVALGDTEDEEGTASAGVEVDTQEEEDVMATVTGEISEPSAGTDNEEIPEASTATDGGETSETSQVTDGEEIPEASMGTDSEEIPEASTGTDGEEIPEASAGTDGEEIPEATGGGETSEVSEEEQAAEGETPVEEETASSGVKEEESEGQDVTEESALPFEDVPPSHWSYPFVLYAYEHELVRGVSETAFNPTGVMTRAAFVTVLYRLSAKLEGADMSAPETTFTDISEINEEFQSAIRWAAAHGIVTGRSEETFAPRENVSRQQMCAILVRYLRDYLSYDLSAYASEAVFADSDTISNYAKEAVSISQAMELIGGREVDGVMIFDPAGSASRAAVVKVLSLAVQKMSELVKQAATEPEEPGDTGDSVTDNGDSATDTGDSSTTDTGDSEKSNSNGSGSSGGNTSSGGHTSSGGNTSSGGGNTSSGGNTSGGGNTTPVTPVTPTPSGPPANEPESAKVVFSYINEVIANYEKNPPENVFVQYCMDILIRDLRSAVAARNAGTLVDEAYVKTHYATDMQQLLDLYNSTSAENAFAIIEYAQTLASPRSKLFVVAQYFGLTDLISQ